MVLRDLSCKKHQHIEIVRDQRWQGDHPLLTVLLKALGGRYCAASLDIQETEWGSKGSSAELQIVVRTMFRIVRKHGPKPLKYSSGRDYNDCLLRRIGSVRWQSLHQLLPAVSPTPTSFSTPTPSDPPSPQS